MIISYHVLWQKLKDRIVYIQIDIWLPYEAHNNDHRIQTRNYGMRIIQFNYNSCTQFKLTPPWIICFGAKWALLGFRRNVGQASFICANLSARAICFHIQGLFHMPWCVRSMQKILFVQVSLQEQSVFIFKVYFICHNVEGACKKILRMSKLVC